MASPAVAVPQVNCATSRQDSPLSINSATKRKRDPSDDGDTQVNGIQESTPRPAVNGVHKQQAEKSLIRDFFDALQSIDTTSHAILKRPLPDNFSDNEPEAKRSKSEENGKPLTIEEKVNQDAYAVLDELVLDINKVVKAQISELESAKANGEAQSDESVSKAISFKDQAHALFRREMSYPQAGRNHPSKSTIKKEPGLNELGGIALTTFGMAPTLKPVFTSLQRSATPDAVLKTLTETRLPNGISFARVAKTSTSSGDDATRTPTLGELFPSPRNLPPLQPPKATKNTTKSNVLSFYHPEPAEKSRYRVGSYFSMNLNTGTWLDYSNATPTTHAKSKQRERAQSLAGHKPSSVELEMSEMEALFRGAFSSFAPCKDDAGAIIPSGQVSHIWWQRVGRRNFDKMVDFEASEDDDKADKPEADMDVDIDEDVIKSAIETWDDSVIDPSLDNILGTKSAEDKEVDDLLEEVTDLIETLASHQRNRNLTLRRTQDRYSTEPVNGDMLRGGNPSHQPNEEEMATYEALKNQLSLIINMLPPYAVARLNSDKLEELNVSTKIEIRTDEYKGVMEEDEPARLARQAQQQAAQSASHRAQQRSSSVSSAVPGFTPGNHQYGAPFSHPLAHQHGHAPGRPVPPVQPYPHTPVRPQPPQPAMYTQRPPSAVPIPQPHPAQPRGPPPQPYRPLNGYPGYTSSMPRPAAASHGTPTIPYPSSPSQPRVAPHAGYQNVAPAGTPTQRFPPSFPSYPQHQQIHPQHMQHAPHPQHGPHHPPPPHQQSPHMQHAQHTQFPPPGQPGHPAPHISQQQNYIQYPNGNQVPRNMSPQVPQGHPYSPSPTPPQQLGHMPRPPYGGAGQGISPAPPQPHYGGGPNAMTPGGGRPQGPGPLGFHTILPEGQQRQMMEQANARVRAQQNATGHMGKVAQGEILGLAGIGLGGQVDVQKLAAAKAMQIGGAMSASPKMPMQAGPGLGPGSAGMNGAPPGAPSSASMPGVSVSPAPGAGFKPPA